VRDLREQAARSATVCADCFQPLAPDASVTMEPRPVLTNRGTKWWRRVPICLRCWLVNMTPSRRKSWIDDWTWFAKSVKRCLRGMWTPAAGLRHPVSYPARMLRRLPPQHAQRPCPRASPGAA
jgi:hypothetical protein